MNINYLIKSQISNYLIKFHKKLNIEINKKISFQKKILNFISTNTYGLKNVRNHCFKNEKDLLGTKTIENHSYWFY